MPTTRTAVDLRNAALREARILSAEEDASAADALLVDDKIVNLHEELMTDGIATWSADAIPADIFQSYVTLVAFDIAPAFGLVATDLAPSREAAKNGIRRLVSGAPSRKPVPAVYF